MSDFYSMLSRHYDVLFPENPATAAFLAAGLAPEAHLLDLACGTGTYVLSLANRGFAVEGVDLDRGMIAQATAKAAGSSARFTVADMLAIDRLFPGRRFDRIYCIGNSIVHLPDRETVAVLIGKCRALLASGGSLVIQIVNFDRVLDRNVTTLPSLDRPAHGVSLSRRYIIAEDRSTVDFVTELTASGETASNAVRLLAFRSEELAALMKAAGFSPVDCFGGFDGALFDKGASMGLVARGRVG